MKRGTMKPTLVNEYSTLTVEPRRSLRRTYCVLRRYDKRQHRTSTFTVFSDELDWLIEVLQALREGEPG